LVDTAIFTMPVWLKPTSVCILILFFSLTNKMFNNNYGPVTLTSFAHVTDGSHCVVT
jgi:hypothetical protein